MVLQRAPNLSGIPSTLTVNTPSLTLPLIALEEEEEHPAALVIYQAQGLGVKGKPGCALLQPDVRLFIHARICSMCSA